MAKKNAREEPPSPGPQVSENVQMSDIVFILDKMELLLKAVIQVIRHTPVLDGFREHAGIRASCYWDDT